MILLISGCIYLPLLNQLIIVYFVVGFKKKGQAVSTWYWSKKYSKFVPLMGELIGCFFDLIISIRGSIFLADIYTYVYDENFRKSKRRKGI